MIVCIGRLPGAITLGCAGSSEKLLPRLWNSTPVSGQTRPLPKLSNTELMNETTLRSRSTTVR